MCATKVVSGQAKSDLFHQPDARRREYLPRHVAGIAFCCQELQCCVSRVIVAQQTLPFCRLVICSSPLGLMLLMLI